MPFWSVTVNVLPAPVPTTVITNANNGQTVTVRAGTPISLVLDSTYWKSDGSSNPAAVAVTGAPVYHPLNGGIPGLGTGTVTVALEAVAPGHSVLSASRTVCGEALACRLSEQHFSVTVLVTQ